MTELFACFSFFLLRSPHPTYPSHCLFLPFIHYSFKICVPIVYSSLASISLSLSFSTSIPFLPTLLFFLPSVLTSASPVSISCSVKSLLPLTIQFPPSLCFSFCYFYPPFSSFPFCSSFCPLLPSLTPPCSSSSRRTHYGKLCCCPAYFARTHTHTHKEEDREPHTAVTFNRAG